MNILDQPQAYIRELREENARLRELAARLVFAGNALHTYARANAPFKVIADWESLTVDFHSLPNDRHEPRPSEPCNR